MMQESEEIKKLSEHFVMIGAEVSDSAIKYQTSQNLIPVPENMLIT